MADVTPTPTERPLPPPDVANLSADRERLEQQATERGAALAARQAATAKAEEAELQPLERAEVKSEQDLASLQAPTPSEKPKWNPKPIVDPKDFQQFSTALLGMALIGGAVSRGNWFGVSSSLNGALKGYIDGSKERADKEFKDYQTKFQEALEHDKAAQKEFEDTLKSKQLSINAMLRNISVIAAKYGREDVRQAAEQRSIDSIWRQVEATDRSIAQLEEQHSRTEATLDLGLKRLAATMGKDATSNLNQYGHWFVEQTVVGGNDKYMKELQSRYGGAIAASTFNEIGKMLSDQGIDPRSMTEFQINNAVQLTAQKQSTNRLQAVERLTGSISQLEKEITRLVERVNGQGVNAVNKTLNQISNQFGDEEVSELRTLMAGFGRQYFEALTMPGSNAQMHASAQDVADQLADPNANIATLQGVLKGANFEISATTQALKSQVEASRQAVIGQGPTVPSPGSPIPAQPPVPGATPVQ